MAQVQGHYGRLWGRGFEVLQRTVLRVQGAGATTFLQNLVTANLTTPPVPPVPEPADAVLPGVPKYVQEQQAGETIQFSDSLRSAVFLDPRGRIVTDSLLWKANDSTYYVDVPRDAGDILFQHMNQYKLRRSKVTIDDVSDQAPVSVIYGTLASGGTPPGLMAGLDPRHPSLGMRVLSVPSEQKASISLKDILDPKSFPDMEGNYELVRRLAGVLEGTNELTNRTALETNHEFLNAVAFDKGCYLGQELTARVHYTGVLRKRSMPLLLLSPTTQIPQAWSLASSLQEGRQMKRFTEEELQKLPTRLPRLSVATAGNMVAVTTASIQPEQEASDDSAAAEWKAIQDSTSKWLDETVAVNCQHGAKITDAETGQNVGQIVAPPVPGTNLVIGLMRLEKVGLLSPGTWSKTNKVKIGDAEFRYLPYLPLWWPEIDRETGKAKQNNDYSEEARSPDDMPIRDADVPSGMSRVELEQVDEPSTNP